MDIAAKEASNAYARAYWKIPENRARKSACTRAYRNRNREKVNLWGRDQARKRRKAGDKFSLRWYYKNKEASARAHKLWASQNKAQTRNYERERNKQPHYKARMSACRRINDALKSRNISKSARSIKLLGCTSLVLQQWLESQFSRGMTWENHSYRGWHIDHVKPCAAFDLSIPEHQQECFHYTNLQPLWMGDNLSKSAKYDL